MKTSPFSIVFILLGLFAFQDVLSNDVYYPDGGEELLTPMPPFAWSCSTEHTGTFVMTILLNVSSSQLIVQWEAGGPKELIEASQNMSSPQVSTLSHNYQNASGTKFITVWGCPENIVELHITEQELTGTLDISPLTSLGWLDANNGSPSSTSNNLSSINWGSKDELYKVNINYNEDLSSTSGDLDLSLWKSIGYVYARECDYTGLKLGSLNTDLEILIVNKNRIAGTVDLSHSPALKDVILNLNKINDVIINASNNFYPNFRVCYLNSNPNLKMENIAHPTNTFPIYSMPNMIDFRISGCKIDYLAFENTTSNPIYKPSFGVLETIFTSGSSLKNQQIDISGMTLLKNFVINDCDVKEIFIDPQAVFLGLLVFNVSRNPNLNIVKESLSVPGTLEDSPLDLHNSPSIRAISINETSISGLTLTNLPTDPVASTLIILRSNVNNVFTGAYNLSNCTSITDIWLNGPTFTLGNSHGSLSDVRLFNGNYTDCELETMIKELLSGGIPSGITNTLNITGNSNSNPCSPDDLANEILTLGSGPYSWSITQ